jgi:phosphoadenosine phosphosulfate reductase
MSDDLNLKDIQSLLSKKSAEESLRILAQLFTDEAVFTTSFGIEDQVITHIIFENNIPVEVSTLDTGRLFPETYKVFNETTKKYQKKIRVWFPDNEGIEKMVTEKGPFSFYYSKENRHECCRLRKVVPLNRLLEGKKCWITGIRAEQSENRGKMDRIEFDDERQLYKFHPLFDWSFEDVKKFIRENNIPYNVLHDKGFVSIGCEPCSREVKPGEDFRAGRWWWEHGSEKECGVHTNEDKR